MRCGDFVWQTDVSPLAGLAHMVCEGSHHFRGGLRSVVPSGLVEEEQWAVTGADEELSAGAGGEEEQSDVAAAAGVAITKVLQTEGGTSIRCNGKDSNWRVGTCECVRCDAKLLAQYC